ncbi:insulinase family protein [Desulfomarina sp.]
MKTMTSSFNGFTLKREEFIKEIDSTVFLFEHSLLKCPILAIKNSDSNKTFSAAFHTIPTDSTGVAHILEHSVLMGSEKYPVKDVFGEINKGGLTTFLNAMTGSDITYYPFATRNLKEYFNIMDVYCDVVFNPLLSEKTFEQEGWHYHQESLDAPLQYQGVVYNEMKGAFSDPIRHIFHHIFAGLLPGSTYAHESGGDPKNIPDLSYEEFRAFHKKHYHPSNGMFFLYGDAPLKEELEFLQSRFFSNFSEPGRRAEIKKGTPPDSPVFINDSYGVDSTDIVEKTFLALGTNVSTVANREENTAFQIIANILFNSDGSPLKNSITSSGLCKDFGGFYMAGSSYRTMMVSYLVGSEAKYRDDFLALYSNTLREMVEKELDRDLVLSELNKFEFSFREEASKAQRGLDRIGKAMGAMKYGNDPFEHLKSEELIKHLRHKALNENYFEELIESHLIDNPSTVTVTLIPDPEKQKKSQEEEQRRLAEYDSRTTEEERSERVRRTLDLIRAQQTPNSVETLSLLPRLSLRDLGADAAFHTVSPEKMFGHEVLVNDLPTNHITYLDIGLDFSCLRPDLLPWLDIFGTILTEIGTEKLNYRQFAKQIATYTGSFSHSLTTYTNRSRPDITRPVLWLHLKCLPDYMEEAMHLLAETLSNVSFGDRTRIREIVGREFAWAEHAAQSEGYNLPATRVFAHLSTAGMYNESFNGITAYLQLKKLALNYDSMEEEFLGVLRELTTLLFNRDNLLLSITADKKEIEQFSRTGSCIPEALGTMKPPPQPPPSLPFPRHEAFITSAEVAFVVQGGNLLKNGAGYNGHFEVLKTYLSRDYLWNSVRQMGGAYGCFIQFGQISGNLALVSYRDPNVRKTYEAYNRIPAVIESLELPTEVMEQLIIGTYGAFTPLQSSAAKGATARNDYLNGISPEYKRERLEEITTTTTEDMRVFAEPFGRMIPECHRSVIGNRMKIEADSDLFEKITEL